MKRCYKILHLYDFGEEKVTLCVEAVTEREANGLKSIGDFSLNLLNADEVALDAVADQGFIEELKKNEALLFCELPSLYLKFLLDTGVIDAPEGIEGMVINEVEDNE